MTQIEFVGVDGCPAGWFSVGFSHSGRYEPEVFASFDQLLTHYKAAKLVLVDMPIGLPETFEMGLRDRDSLDKEARTKLLTPIKPGVFPVPARAAVEYLANYPRNKDGAKEINMQNIGKSISEFAIGIMPKIAEIDRLMLTHGADATPKVREIHPEICFWALNGRKSMGSGKKTVSGFNERFHVLSNVEPRTKEILAGSRFKYPQKSVLNDDDILDALAAAVTAYRGYLDRLQTLPAKPRMDPKGLTMEMVYWIP